MMNNDNNNLNEEIETLDFNPNDKENYNQSQEQNVVFNNSSLFSETEEPLPAYTNPQNINPMPGFDNTNTINIQPISFENEKKPKKKGSKILFIILVLLSLAGVGFGTFYILKYTDLLIKKDTITINVKNLNINIGDDLSTNINDFANINGIDTKNCNLDTTLVDNTKAGEYEFIIKCNDTEKKGKVTVVDNRELVVETKNVYKVKGDSIDVTEFIKNIDETLTYEFVDIENVNNILKNEKGIYIVKIKVSNGNKNIEVEGNLIILEHSVKGHLICVSKEQNINAISGVMTVAEKFAILNDGNNGFSGITEEIHTFKFNDETEYTNYFTTYKKDNKVTINNITGKANFDDNLLTITITNNKTEESVINEYGTDNMKNYQTIRTYFINDLKYSCSYKNIG